jgi:hypothetical protein
MSSMAFPNSRPMKTYLFLVQHIPHRIVGVVLRLLEELGDINHWVARIFLRKMAIL